MQHKTVHACNIVYCCGVASTPQSVICTAADGLPDAEPCARHRFIEIARAPHQRLQLLDDVQSLDDLAKHHVLAVQPRRRGLARMSARTDASGLQR